MLPTAPPALQAEFTPKELDTRDATRAAACSGLPSPAWAARRFAMALCEVTARLLVVQLRGRRVRATHVGGPIAFGTRT